MADGRYGNIKVYTGARWAQPIEIQEYSGSDWISLGTDASPDISKGLGVYKSSSNLVTNVLQTKQTTYGAWWSTGYFQLPGSYSQGYWCLAPGTDLGNFEHYVRCNIFKTANTDQRIYEVRETDSSGNVKSFENSNNATRILWLANGKIEVTTKYNGSARTVVSSNAVGANTWVTLNVTFGTSARVSINFNGTVTTGYINQYISINKVAYGGDTGLRFQGPLSIRMVKYGGDVGSSDFNSTPETGNMGTPHRDESTNWVPYTPW